MLVYTGGKNRLTDGDFLKMSNFFFYVIRSGFWQILTAIKKIKDGLIFSQTLINHRSSSWIGSQECITEVQYRKYVIFYWKTKLTGTNKKKEEKNFQNEFENKQAVLSQFFKWSHLKLVTYCHLFSRPRVRFSHDTRVWIRKRKLNAPHTRSRDSTLERKHKLPLLLFPFFLSHTRGRK